MPEYLITRLIDLEFFQEAMDRFFEATNVIRLGLKDPEGITLVSAYQGGPSRACVLCRLIRTSPEGVQRCLKSDRRGVLLSRDKGSYVFYTCHAGMTDVAVPLFCDGQFIGALMSGQFFFTPPTEETIEDILNRMRGLPVEEEEVRQAIQQVPVYSRERLEASVRLVWILGQNIVDRELSLQRKTEIYETQLNIAQEQQRAAELEVKLQTARYAMLQAQVNPHFLFNALNTVARLAMLENASQTEKMAYSLARLLRYSLRGADTLVPLEEEFDQVRSYLEIQKIRFQDRLEVDLQLAESVRKINIPCMSLQPLVENALVHGIEAKLGPGRISVRATKKKDNVEILVEDSGVGMSPERLQQVLKGQAGDSRKGVSGLGVQNVLQRLEHCFTGRHTFEMQSQVGKGTSIRILVPLTP